MARPKMSRRDFGRYVGAGGLAIALPTAARGGLLPSPAGAGTARTAQATPTWRTPTGRLGAGLGAFDTAMRDFMRPRNISAGALAVVRNGRLVLARGYTYTSDTALASTQPTSLFRVGSLSKAITAAAAAHLVQEGNLSVIDRVVDRIGLTTLSGDPLPAGYDQITVNNLAQHRAGFVSSHTSDPTYRDRYVHDTYGLDLPISRADMTRFAAQSPLAPGVTPGSTYAYANYGYWLLGDVIDAATPPEVDYATYIQQNILAPVGITRMRPATSFLTAWPPDEVLYFPQAPTASSVFDDDPAARVAPPYGSFNLENRVASGGWAASVVDYVRFARIFDGGSPVLDDWMIDYMLGEPENHDGSSSWYGYGWLANTAGTTWHDGSLPGTRTVVTRRYDGTTWAAFFNQREDASGLLYDYTTITQPLHAIANSSSTVWPSVDYFPNYFPA